MLSSATAWGFKKKGHRTTEISPRWHLQPILQQTFSNTGHWNVSKSTLLVHFSINISKTALGLAHGFNYTYTYIITYIYTHVCILTQSTPSFPITWTQRRAVVKNSWQWVPSLPGGSTVTTSTMIFVRFIIFRTYHDLIHIYIYIYLCIDIYMHIHIHIRICICVCMYVCNVM